MKVIEIKYLPLPIADVFINTVVQIHVQGEGFSRDSYISYAKIPVSASFVGDSGIESKVLKHCKDRAYDQPVVMSDEAWDRVKISKGTAIV